MKHAAFLLAISMLLLSACVAAPTGPGGNAVTPQPAQPENREAPAQPAAPTAPAPAGSEPTATSPIIVGPIVSTAVGAASTVDLRDLKTPTPVPLPQTGADVTIGGPTYAQTVNLKQGQTLALVLEYKNWVAPAYDPQVLRSLPWPGDPPPNMQAWLFQAHAPGTTTLSTQTPDLPCPPPGGGPCSMRPIYVFEVTVVVAP